MLKPTTSIRKNWMLAPNFLRVHLRGLKASLYYFQTGRVQARAWRRRACAHHRKEFMLQGGIFFSNYTDVCAYLGHLTKKKKEVEPHIALCSEYTRANLAVAVRGFVQKVAHVAMSEGTYECKSISTSKTFD